MRTQQCSSIQRKQISQEVAFKCQKSTVIIYHISTDEDPNTRNRNEVREVVQIKMPWKIIRSMLYYSLTVVDSLAFYCILWDYVIIIHRQSSCGYYKAMAVFHHKVHYAERNWSGYTEWSYSTKKNAPLDVIAPKTMAYGHFLQVLFA